MAILNTIHLFSLFLVLNFSTKLSHCLLKNIYSWELFDLKFPNDSMSKSLIEDNPSYRQQMFPYSFDVWQDKLFFSLGRSSGVPTPLAYVKLNDSNETQTPPLIPYPGWNQTDILHSVRLITIDACNRLWIIDEGASILERVSRILIYDLKTDQLIVDHMLEEDSRSLPVVDLQVDATKENCSKALAYITHFHNITVYDFEADSSNTFRPVFDQASNYVQQECNLSNESYTKMNHITLLSSQPDGYRTLYYRPATGNEEFTVSSKILRDENDSNTLHQYHLVGCRQGLGSSTIFDENTGHIFQTLDGNIIYWNFTRYPNEVSLNTTGTFPTDETDLSVRKIKLDANGNLWLLFSRHDSDISNAFAHDGNKLNHKMSIVSVADVIRGSAHNVAPFAFPILCLYVSLIFLSTVF